MPELPEVETSLRGVEPYLHGKIIKQIVVRTQKLRWAVSDELQHMQGAKIVALSRRAKYLILHTTQGDILIHLGMSGSLGILQENQQPAGKHDHVDLITQDGRFYVITIRVNSVVGYGRKMPNNTN